MKFLTPLLLLCSSLSLTALSFLSCPASAQIHNAGKAQTKTVRSLPALAASGAALRLIPAVITLRNPYEECRALVETGSGQKEPQDVSAKAEWRTLDPRIAAVDENGIARPKRDGKTFLIARWQGREARVPVVVSGMKNAPAPRFVADVMPVLTHAGCNQGACHGAASGKGGFKLSLLGYDPDADYLAITRANRARRVSVAQPEQSLLLRKPVLAVYHKGGKRFMEGSTEYSIVRDWIAAGLPAPSPKELAVTKLDVTPPIRTIPINGGQRFAVTATYADGSKRDVTTETLFSASDETVATVTTSGEAKVTGNGEGAIIVRYQGLVGTARVVSPYGPALADRKGEKEKRRKGEKNIADVTPPLSTLHSPLSTIDKLVNAKLTALGLETSPRCSDSDFLRRSYLDVTGRIPTADEARAFLSDTAKDKRDKLIDTLLASPEYVDFWTLKWGDILRCSRQKLAVKGMNAYHDWIRQSVADNKPWDQMARELVLAQGSAFNNGAANYYRTAAGPLELAETTSEIFLGVRIACARCHNHPYEKWTQNQYYQMAAFFARVGSKPGERAGEPVIVAVAAGEVRHPKTAQVVMPCALDAKAVPDAEGLDRRQALADWLTSGQNPFFAHAVVNRVWKHYMGMGFVEPVDDLRATNPPSNAALYDWLAQDLAQNHFDLKRLMRNILRSDAYQRSPDATRNNVRDSRYYSHFAFKRLSAEQMLDAIAGVTGVGDKFDGYPMGTRACELPDTGVASYFLDLFGRPARNITCECERSEMPTLGQMLHLMNDVGLNARLSSKTGRVSTLLEAKTPDAKLVEEMYLSALSRFPTTEEKTRAVKALSTALPANRQKTAEDLLWALLNSKEFVFNH